MAKSSASLMDWLFGEVPASGIQIQPYRFLCSCSHVMEGVRPEVLNVVPCQKCGRLHAVLPRNTRPVALRRLRHLMQPAAAGSASADPSQVPHDSIATPTQNAPAGSRQTSATKPGETQHASDKPKSGKPKSKQPKSGKSQTVTDKPPAVSNRLASGTSASSAVESAEPSLPPRSLFDEPFDLDNLGAEPIPPQPNAAEDDDSDDAPLIRPADTIAAPRKSKWLRRLAVLAACLVILASSGGIAFSRIRANARIKLEAALDSGMTHFRQAEFNAAALELKKASDASFWLNASGSRARTAQQLHKECLSWLHLAREPMEDFFAQLETLDTNKGQDWMDGFGRTFGGRYMVFDGELTWKQVAPTLQPKAGQRPPPPPEDEPAADPSGDWVPQFAWVWHGKRFRVRLSIADAPFCGLFEDHKPQRILFGGKILGLRASTLDESSFFVEMEPESCVLLTQKEPLDHFHWPDSDEQLSQLLSRQQQLLGTDSK